METYRKKLILYKALSLKDDATAVIQLLEGNEIKPDRDIYAKLLNVHMALIDIEEKLINIMEEKYEKQRPIENGA